MVASEGKGVLAFHLVLSGEATVSAHDREVRLLVPGEYFGELVEEEPAFARGQLTPLRACSVRRRAPPERPLSA